MPDPRPFVCETLHGAPGGGFMRSGGCVPEGRRAIIARQMTDVDRS
jgi:hypothetical protein